MEIQPILTNILNEEEAFSFITHDGPGITMPVHRHIEFEIHYIENCNGIRRVIGENVDVISGNDLVLVGPNVMHSWSYIDNLSAPDQNDFILHCIPNIVSQGLLERKDMALLKRLKQNAQSGIAFGDDTIARVKPLIEKIKHSKDISKTSVLLYIIEILIIMAEANDGHVFSVTNYDKPFVENNEKVSQMIEFIINNFCNNISRDKVSELVSMSADGANRCFKRATGHTIMDYIIQLRLGYSTKLLLSTHFTVSEICFKCGFNSLSYFIRCFRKKFGVSPLEFKMRYLV